MILGKGRREPYGPARPTDGRGLMGSTTLCPPASRDAPAKGGGVVADCEGAWTVPGPRPTKGVPKRD